jgi:hypothetical protein
MFIVLTGFESLTPIRLFPITLLLPYGPFSPGLSRDSLSYNKNGPHHASHFYHTYRRGLYIALAGLNLLLYFCILGLTHLSKPALSIHNNSPRATTLLRLYNQPAEVPAIEYQAPNVHSLFSRPKNYISIERLIKKGAPAYDKPYKGAPLPFRA